MQHWDTGLTDDPASRLGQLRVDLLAGSLSREEKDIFRSTWVVTDRRRKEHKGHSL